jgi:hypothetical protein
MHWWQTANNIIQLIIMRLILQAIYLGIRHQHNTTGRIQYYKIFIKSESSVAAPCDLRHVRLHGPITEIRQKMARLEVEY